MKIITVGGISELFGRLLLVSLTIASATGHAGDFEWAKPYPGSLTKTQQAPAQGSYRLVTEVDEGGGIGGNVIKGRVSRFVFQHPPETPLETVYAYYEGALKAAGMQVLFECADRACGPAAVAGRWLAVTGISVKTGQHCRYVAGQIADRGGEVRIALMVGEQASQLDIIETPVP